MGSMPSGRGVAVNRDQKADPSCLHAQRDKLFTSMPLGNAAGTEIRTRLRLRSTCPGANNRLDVASIFSFDRGTRAQYAMPGALPKGVPSAVRCQSVRLTAQRLLQPEPPMLGIFFDTQTMLPLSKPVNPSRIPRHVGVHEGFGKGSAQK